MSTRKARACHRDILKHIKKYGADQTCSICIEQFVPHDNVIITSCDHAFHSNCFSKYTEELCYSETKTLQEFGIDEAAIYARAWLLMNMGGPCPNCRTKSPLVHKLTLREPSVNLDVTIEIAECKNRL